jgi:hypothetical protein
MRCKSLITWMSKRWFFQCFDAPDELRTATYIVRRTTLQIWQVSDSVTISTNTHPIRTLTWAVPTSWADAANGPLAWVNICGIVTSPWTCRQTGNFGSRSIARLIGAFRSDAFVKTKLHVLGSAELHAARFLWSSSNPSPMLYRIDDVFYSSR